MGEIKGGLIFIKKYSLEAREENKLVSSIYFIISQHLFYLLRVKCFKLEFMIIFTCEG